jgi:hypothetical protein
LHTKPLFAAWYHLESDAMIVLVKPSELKAFDEAQQALDDERKDKVSAPEWLLPKQLAELYTVREREEFQAHFDKGFADGRKAWRKFQQVSVPFFP